SYITRFDYIVNNGEIKLREIHADTLTGYVAPSVANQVLCDHHSVINPNCLDAELHKAGNKIIVAYQ
ncbi:glutathionylspermidine synthase family protein, partial [Bacillus cereus]